MFELIIATLGGICFGIAVIIGLTIIMDKENNEDD